MVNPNKLTKEVLRQKRSGLLTCSEDTINKYLRRPYSDSRRNHPLGVCESLIYPPQSTMDLNLKETSLMKVQDIVKRTRASSAPGPNGVSYKAYKNRPKLLHCLWRALKVVWRRGKIADSWRYAECVVAKRLTRFLLSNNYIDISVQKGGIPGVPGYMAHTGVVTQFIMFPKM